MITRWLGSSSTSSSGQGKRSASISAALPTVARLGYALGASFVGILANRAGFAAATGPDEMAHVARVIFAGSLPVALLGLAAMLRFVTARG